MGKCGIDSSGVVHLKNSSFLYAVEQALVFSGMFQSTVESTLIARSEIGAEIRSGSEVSFDHVTLVENDVGLSLSSWGADAAGTIVENSILWDNYRSFSMQGGAFLNVAYTLFQEEDFAGQDGNIPS